MESFYAVEGHGYGIDNPNFALFWSNGPPTETNTYDWALQIVRANLREAQTYQSKLASGDSIGEIGRFPNLAEQWDAIPDKLLPQGNPRIADCWISRGWSLPVPGPVAPCDNK